MISPHETERIGHNRLTEPLPFLMALGEPELAARLERAVADFLSNLAKHRESDTYRVRLRDPAAVSCDELVSAMLEVADVLRLAGDPDGAGSVCAGLAARIGVLWTECDPAICRALLFIEHDQANRAHVLVHPFDREDAAAVPGLGDDEACR